MAFLYLSKAYHKLWRGGLVHKLHKIRLKGRMLRWIISLLSDRKGRVIFRGKVWSWRYFSHGLPQGGVTSPILFNLFTADAFDSFKRSEGHAFADDMIAIATASGTPRACGYLSADLDAIAKWAKRNRLQFNIGKCEDTAFSRQSSRITPVVTFNQHKVLFVFDFPQRFTIESESHLHHIPLRDLTTPGPSTLHLPLSRNATPLLLEQE